MTSVETMNHIIVITVIGTPHRYTIYNGIPVEIIYNFTKDDHAFILR